MTIKVIQADRGAELKPCPFCGAAAEIWECPGLHNVACSGCGSQPSDCIDVPDLQAAIIVWNTRASHADPLRRALEPFSIALGNVADTDLETYPDSETIEFSGAPELITWGHLREARRVLSALSNTQPSPAYSMEKNK